MIDAELRSLLVCPVDHSELIDEPDLLVCSECGRRYPVVDDIPVLLAHEATLPSED